MHRKIYWVLEIQLCEAGGLLNTNLYQIHEVWGLRLVKLLLPHQNRHTVCPLGTLSWCGMSWDWGVCHWPLHSSSKTHYLDTHVKSGLYSVYRKLWSHTLNLSKHIGYNTVKTITAENVTLLPSSEALLICEVTGVLNYYRNTTLQIIWILSLPISCIFWIQLRLPHCCAPPNTHNVWGQLSDTKVQCSYRDSKPSHSGMSHSWLSGGVGKNNN